MRRVVPFVLAAASLLPMATVHSQGGAGKQTIRACSLLSKELVVKVLPTPHNKFVLDMPPQEEPLGTSGSACDYAGIGLQIDPFTPARLDALYKELGKTWTPVPDVGDGAYFRDNRGMFAELFARAGARVFTIQMSVPTGSTAESVKPTIIALAKAIVPKLR